MFDPNRAVEIIEPSYGSGYRIGGRLVLTSAHLFEGVEVGASCKVRNKAGFPDNPIIDARLEWKAPNDVDVALVALSETVGECGPVTFGQLPRGAEIVPFDLYGWPKWAQTKDQDPRKNPKAGGRHIVGEIYLADRSPGTYLVIEPRRVPEAPQPGAKGSEWEGISGAAVVCNGLVVAVQRHHQNPQRSASLEAEPLSKIDNDSGWRDLLAEHGILTDPKPVSVRDVEPRQQLFVNLPDRHNRVIGRDAIREELIERLTSGESSALSLEGGAGIGKTTLALAVAYDPRISEYFSDGVLWASLGQQTNIENQQAIWAEALGIDPACYPNPEDVKLAIRNSIGNRRFLLVIDDTWGINEANLLRCGGRNCCYLLTTRDQDIARVFASIDGVQPVEELPSDDAYALLTALAPEVCGDFPQETRVLSNRLYGLPLVIELVGAYLAGSQVRTFKNQRSQGLAAMLDPEERLKQAQTRLGSVSGLKQTLKEMVELSLADLNDAAKQAFCSLGAFVPKPAKFDVESAKVVTQANEDTLSMLVNRRLCDIDEHENLSVHPAVMDVARTCTSLATHWLHGLHYLGIVEENRENWRLVQGVYDQAIQAAARSLSLERETFLEFVWGLRIYHERRGLWQVQIELYQKALTILQEKGDREYEAIILNNLGSVYHNLGSRNQARHYYEQALAIRREVGDLRGEAVTLNNLGGVADSLGEYSQALKYFEQALSISREIDNRLGEATTLNNIGLAYDHLGDQSQALEYYKQVLPIRREVGDRSGEATTLNNIGQAYINLKQWKPALDFFRQALPIKQEEGDRLGEATVLNNMGGAYHGLQDQNQALQYLKQALGIVQEISYKSGETTTRVSIAAIYTGQGKLQDAIKELEIVIRLDQETSSPELDIHLKALEQVKKKFQDH